MERRDLVPGCCLASFTLVWIALGISPDFRDAWLLENLPTVVVVPALVVSYRRFRFSDQAYVQGTILLILHTIGSHYTYSLVPIGDWARDAFGLSRNHYDRFVHFAAGALLLVPNRDVFFRRRALGRVGLELFLTFTVVAWWALLYELVEWWTAIVVDPAAGIAFLGTQGDQWDSQKDMACACLGAALAAGVEAWRASSSRPARAASGTGLDDRLPHGSGCMATTTGEAGCAGAAMSAIKVGSPVRPVACSSTIQS